MTGAALTVVMRDMSFNSSQLTIRLGQTVVWRNDDDEPHTATSGSCPGGVCAPMPGWDSGILNPGQSFSHTFTAAGTFPYYCQIHGAMMQGTINVTQ
jgi:plastocyanin